MKPCDRCKQPSSIRYRIRYDQTKCWVLACYECWQKLSYDNPYYCYGGTWKSRQSN